MAYIGREPLGGEVILLNSIESQFNGSLTTFNLTRTVSGVTSAFYPIGSEQLLVSLGGVIQKPDTTGDTGFRISFNTIIFAVAPVAGTTCFIVAYGNVTDIGAPANNTVTTDKLVDGSVTPAKLSTGGPWWLSSGNVGIGTTGPITKLDTRGTLHVGGSSEGIWLGNVGDNSAYDNIKLYYTGFNSGSPRVYLTPRTQPGSGTVNTYLHLLSSTGVGVNNMGLLVDGSVGIGTTSPQYKLHVVSGGIVGGSGRGGGFTKTLFESNATVGAYWEFQTLPTSTVNDILFSKGTTGLYGVVGYDNSTDKMRFYTAGDWKMTIDSTGNVGIGTTNPSAKLDVRGWTNITSATVDSNWNSQLLITGNSTYQPKLTLSSSNGYRWSIRNDDPTGNGELKFKYEEGNFDVVTFTRTGNVGIGITTPQNTLDLGSATNNKGISWGGTGANYANIWTEYSTGSLHLGQGVRPIGTSTGWVSSTGISSVGRAVIKLNFNTGDIGFHTATPTTVADGSAITVDQRMIISGSGNVGIGTTNPQYRFHVHGRACITDGTGTFQSLSVGTTSSSTGTNFGTIDVNGSMYSGYYLRNNNNTTFGIFAAAEQYVDLGTITNIPLHFKINDSRVMSIVAGGNVGIGVTNPPQKLYVNGTVQSTGRFIFGGSAEGGARSLAAGSGATIVDTGININATNGGGTMLVLACRNTSNGTSTQSAVYMLQFYYDGDNTPTKTLISGSDIMAINKSATNTLTVTCGAGNWAVTAFVCGFNIT